MRFIFLDVESSTLSSVTVEAPLNANLAPPGYYYIHVINSSGIPSAARIIKVPGSGTGGGGDGSGGTVGGVFYSVAYPGNAVGPLTAASNTRYGEQAANSSSVLVGKSLKSWKLHMRRVGTSSGTVRAVVRRSSDDATVATFSETIDAATLPTSFAEQSFTLTTARLLQAGDRILIEFSGSGRVELSVWQTDQIDGGNTRRVRYSGGAYGSSSTDDVVGVMSSEGESDGGAGSAEVFYDAPGPGGAAGPLYAGSNTRYGEEARTSSSVLVGESLRTLKVRLRRSGSASGTVRAVVRNSADTVVATFGGSFDASSLTTSYAERTFTLTTPRTIQTGDRILVEYSGPARIDVDVHSTDQVDGSNTRRTRYDGTSYIGGSTADIAGSMSS
jgi:hypothetical protein